MSVIPSTVVNHGIVTEVPWKQPEGLYTAYMTDGPDGAVQFTIGTGTYLVSPTMEEGCHTGRGRFHVQCLTCDKTLHEATTGPRQFVGYHVTEHP